MAVIPLIVCDQIDSTSSHAERLLSAGERTAPFAIFAREQSAGRGRLGRTWSSPRGNLYLTIALPPQNFDLTLLPIITAKLLAQWCYETFNLRLTVKWPNDLLFAGAKCGGILCEASAQGGAVKNILVGIGLNLNELPQTPVDYATTSIGRVLRGSIDPEAAARTLVDFWALNFRTVASGFDPKGYEYFAVEPGQLWQSTGTQDVMALEGYTSTAQLKLRTDSAEPTPKILNSAEHDYRWIYQAATGQCRPPVLVADVGNTASKFAFFEHADADSPSVAGGVSRDEISFLKEWRCKLDDLGWKRVAHWPVHVGSVNPHNSSVWREALMDCGFQFVPVPKRPLRWHGPYPLAQLGIDRLALMESFITEKQNRAGVVVSLGTATTIDAMGPEGMHLGGWILPGVQTSLTALHEKTGLLPALNLVAYSPSTALGFETADAMRHGVVSSVVAVTKHACAEAARQLSLDPQQIEVVVTGGFASMLKDVLKATYRPEMVLDGLRQMVVGGLRHQ